MPQALPLIAVALTAVGTGVAVYSSLEQGKAADDAAKSTARAENANAKAAQDAAALEAQQVRRSNLLRLGSQRANAAKSGVLINDSAQDVMYDTAIQGELESLTTLYGGASQANYNRSRASIARVEGANAKSASYFKAGSSLIGGASSGAEQGYRMYKDSKK